MTTENNSKQLQEQINQLINSMDSLLKELPSLEVNTMIVNQIIPDYFIPEKTYQEIYAISDQSLKEKAIDQSLWDNYLNLRYNLEWEFLKLYPQEDNLPAPDQIKQVLQNNPILVQILRKIAAIKTSLDQQNYSLINNNKNEVFQGQTKINLEGRIINLYTENILTHPQKDVILEIHRDNITFGQKHWRNLLQNILDFLQKSL